jgi:predicted kinase
MSKMIILVGLPGSGKSTIAETHFKQDYYYINQDKMGNREACISAVKKVLESGGNVIIDRVNSTRKQRAYWIELGIGYNCSSITCIVLDVDPEICVGRIVDRKGHETITEEMDIEKKRQIVHQFAKTFESPTLEEGFSSIVITR